MCGANARQNPVIRAALGSKACATKIWYATTSAKEKIIALLAIPIPSFNGWPHQLLQPWPSVWRTLLVQQAIR